jgi:hypothetical protein
MTKKTYESEIAGVRQDMKDDGTYGDTEMVFAVAEALLDDPEFKKLAKDKFPGRSDELLKECVACNI